MKSSKELLQEIIEARDKCDKLDAELSEAKKQKDIVQTALIERMDLEDHKSFRVEGLALAVRGQSLYVSVLKQDQPELLRYLDEECGASWLIKQTVNNQSLRGFINERLKKGEAINPIIKLFFKPTLSIKR